MSGLGKNTTKNNKKGEKAEREFGHDQWMCGKRMTMINVAFPGVPSVGLQLSPWRDAAQPSQPCKYHKPVVLLFVRSITTKRRLQLWQIGWMCLLGTNVASSSLGYCVEHTFTWEVYFTWRFCFLCFTDWASSCPKNWGKPIKFVIKDNKIMHH